MCVKALSMTEKMMMMERTRAIYASVWLTIAAHEMGEEGKAWELERRRRQGINEVTQTEASAHGSR